MSDRLLPASVPWTTALAARLIRQTARHAPPSLAERLEEEWLADLAAQVSPLSRLSFALGCCWATLVIAHEHGVAVAAVATGGRSLVLSLESCLPRRTSAFLVVLCAHMGLTYLLATHLVFPQPDTLIMLEFSRPPETVIAGPPATEPAAPLSFRDARTLASSLAGSPE